MNQGFAGRKENGPMMTTGEVARLLNIHINTVRRWNNGGAINAYRIGPRRDRRFRQGDVSNLLLQK
jgi:excisionase family DNA binding protein